MSETAIIIPNINEVIRRGMPWKIFPIEFINKLITAGVAYTEMGLFWNSHCNERLIITPVKIPDVYIDYIRLTMKYNTLQQIVTNDIMNSITELNALYKELINEAKYLIFYGASKEAYSICDSVTKYAKRTIKNDIPSEIDYEIALLYDSKSCFRNNIGCCSELTLPHIVTNKQHISSALYKFYKGRIPCMVKAEFGVGGYGNILLQNFSQGFESWLQTVEEAYRFAPYIQSGDMIIEKYIISIKQGCFSGFGYISEDSSCVTLGYVEEMRDSKGFYIGSTNLKPEHINLIKDATENIGLILAEKKYKGHFCVDFILSSNYKLYVLEINTRRCASSYIFDIINRLNFEDNVSWYHRLNISVTLTQKNNLVEDVIDVFDKLSRIPHYQYALPIQVSGLLREEPYLGIIIFAKNKNIVKNCLKTLITKLQLMGVTLDV